MRGSKEWYLLNECPEKSETPLVEEMEGGMEKGGEIAGESDEKERG